MPPRKQPEPTGATRRQPATTPEDREQQMIALADALAEKQLMDGTASSQLITHYLKLGTSVHQLEKEKIRQENLRLEAQVTEMASRTRSEEALQKVLDAISVYNGTDDDDDD